MIRYIGTNLSSSQDTQELDYKNKDLLIIPLAGNNQLYIIEPDGNDEYPENYDIKMILTTDLYTHILVSPSLVTDSSPQFRQECYAIEDLVKDPDNQNIVLVPIPVEDYCKFFVYLVNYEDDEYKYFNNIPAVIYLMMADYGPSIFDETEHFIYTDNPDFDLVFFERQGDI